MRRLKPEPLRVMALRFALALVVTVHSTVAGAIDYTWAPQARAEMQLNDNIRGRSENGRGAWGFDFGGGVGLLAESDRFRSRLVPRILLRRFVIGENLDTEEYYVNFDNELRYMRVSSTLDFAYARSSTLTSEATDIGVLDQVRNKDTIRISPSVLWTVSERWTLQGSFNFSDVSYIDAENTGLVDYSFIQSSAGAFFSFNETLQLSGNVYVSEFETPDTGGRTRNYGNQWSATKTLSDTLTLSGALGYIYSEIEFVDSRVDFVFDPLPRLDLIQTNEKTSANGITASANFRKEFENLLVEFDYVRQVSPSGRGEQSTSDEFSLQVTRSLSKRLRLVFNGDYDQRASQGGDNNAALNRDLIALRGGIRFNLTEQLTVAARYRFRRRSSDRGGRRAANATANAVFVSINYNGDPRDLSDGF